MEIPSCGTNVILFLLYLCVEKHMKRDLEPIKRGIKHHGSWAATLLVMLTFCCIIHDNSSDLSGQSAKLCFKHEASLAWEKLFQWFSVDPHNSARKKCTDITFGRSSSCVHWLLLRGNALKRRFVICIVKHFVENFSHGVPAGIMTHYFPDLCRFHTLGSSLKQCSIWNVSVQYHYYSL